MLDVTRQSCPAPFYMQFGSMDASQLAAALSANLDAPPVLHWALAALCRLADKGLGNGSIFHSGCIPVLLQVLSRYGATETQLVGRIAEALRFLARNEDNRREAVDLNAVRLLAAVLAVQVDLSASVAESCCRALANLSEEAVECVEALPPVISVLVSHVDLVGPVEAACSALRNLANDAANCAAAVSSGALSALVTVLSSQQCAQSPSLFEACVGALGNFAALPENQVELVRVCAVPLFIQAFMVSK